MKSVAIVSVVILAIAATAANPVSARTSLAIPVTKTEQGGEVLQANPSERADSFLVAQQAIQAAEKGDFQTVIGLTDPQLVSAVGKDKIIRTLSRMKQKAKERGGMTQIEFSSEFGVDESVSTVTINLYFGDGTRDTKTVRLKRLEDKRWVITS